MSIVKAIFVLQENKPINSLNNNMIVFRSSFIAVETLPLSEVL